MKKLNNNQSSGEIDEFLFLEEALNKTDVDDLMNMLSHGSDDKDIIKNGMMIIYSIAIKSMSVQAQEMEKYFNEVYGTKESYKQILKSCATLSRELNFSNSLNCSVFFTYLLWNGYFSKNKNLVFQSSKRASISGCYPYDIMNGRGVCLNFSLMLNDFLNEIDYNSAVISNVADKHMTRNYEIGITRNFAKENLIVKILTFLFSPLSKKIGNHAFCLIEDGEEFYLYDPTNVLALNILDKNNANVIDGRGAFKLNPIYSYINNSTDKSLETLKKLNAYSIFKPLDVSFGNVLHRNLKYIDQNKPLLDDFYDEIRGDVNNIAWAVQNAKAMKRQYKEKHQKNKITPALITNIYH